MLLVTVLALQMVAKGHIYRGRKPVHWSPSSRTALAEAELEYPDGHTSKSIYVALPVSSASESAPQELKDALENAAFAVWTTTPWTIPANMAVAVNERLQYAVVQVCGIPTGFTCSYCHATRGYAQLLLCQEMWHMPRSSSCRCTCYPPEQERLWLHGGVTCFAVYAGPSAR
jgi:isoleucyl-tRNA synthetase